MVPPTSWPRRQLRLTDLALEGPGTRLAGEAEVGLDRPLARGRLAGEVRDLAALAPWIGQKIAGAVTLNVDLTTPEGRQDIVAKLGANGIAGDFGSLRTAALDASLRDALGRGAVDASLTAQDFTAPGLAVDQAKVGVNGRLAELAITASAAGSQGGQAFDIATAAGLDVLGARKVVKLTSLGGTLMGQKLRLMQPATVTLAGAAMAVDQVDVQFGAARAQANLSLDEQRVRGGLTLNELALAALEPFGLPSLAGKGQARLDLSGSPKAPEATLSLDVRQLALDPVAKVKADASLQATVRGGRLDANLTAKGLGATPLTATARLPVTFSLQPFAFAVDNGAPLTARVAGPVDLARAVSLAALDGVQLRGVLQLAVDLGGALDRPQLGGTMTLANGSVQEVSSGFALSQLTLRAHGAGERLVLDEFGGKDPTGGKLSATGSVGLPPGGGVTYQAAITAARARVLENGLGTVVLSGNLTAAGDQASATLNGRLTIDEGDLEIPDKTGGPSVPVMQVTEVNGGPAAAGPPKPAGPPFALSFDVGVEIPARFFVRGSRARFGMGRQAAGQGRSRRPAGAGRAQCAARLLRPARPAVHDRARGGRFRRHPAAAADDRPAGQGADRGRRRHSRVEGAGRRPQADPVERAHDATGRDPVAAAVRHLGGPGDAGAGAAAGGGRAAAPRWRCGQRRPDHAAAGLRPRHAGRAERCYHPGELRPRRQVYQRQGLCGGAARRHRRQRQGQRPRRPDPATVGRHLGHRAVADRRRLAMEVRLLMAIQTETPAIVPAPGLALPSDGSTFGTLFDLNLIGLWTLYRKEVWRFWKVMTQTILAPVISTLVFLAIFALAMHRADTRIGDLSFLQFLAPGLIMMAVVQNAFANTSSSLMIAKIQGNIVDYLMPPLGPGELLFGITMAGITRGVVVGLAVWLCMLPFVPLLPLHPLLIAYYTVAASLMLSLLGFLGGLWAEKFDQLAAVTNFVITPLSFLSGTFYSVEALPEALRWVAHVNPFFYMIDGIRFGFTGHADGSVPTGVVLLAVVNLALWLWAYRLMRRGYRLKA